MTDKKPEPDNHNAEPYIVWGFMALLPACIGGFFAFYGWAFASMVDPALEGWDRSKAIAADCLPEVIPWVAMFLGGINTFFLCLVYATARVRWSRPTFLKIVAPVIFVVAALLVLWVVITR